MDTEIDELLRVLSEKESITVDAASKLMGVDVKTMHTWVDSLVEEKVILLDYDFLTPIIKLTPEKKSEIIGKKKAFETSQKENMAKKLGLRGAFIEKAKKRGFDDNKIKVLWKKFVEINESSLKKEFYEKAIKKDIDTGLDNLWMTFYQQYKN